MDPTNTELININGLEVYQSDIDILCDEYISTLPDPNMVYKSQTFKGLLLYIYQRKLKHIIELDKYNNNIPQYNNNYDLLDEIFYNIYIPLCYKYSITPTILGFSCFVDIDNNILSDMKTGVHRQNGSIINPSKCRIVKKWYSVIESGLADKAINENGIGSIFVLKARFQWQESAQQVEVISSATQSTPEQIAERYKTAEKPQLETIVQ